MKRTGKPYKMDESKHSKIMAVVKVDFYLIAFEQARQLIDACGTLNGNLFTFQPIFSFYPGGPKNKI
jgi:hypothetical protein